MTDNYTQAKLWAKAMNLKTLGETFREEPQSSIRQLIHHCKMYQPTGEITTECICVDDCVAFMLHITKEMVQIRFDHLMVGKTTVLCVITATRCVLSVTVGPSLSSVMRNV